MIKRSSTLNELITSYMSSNYFANSLSSRTRSLYQDAMEDISDTVVSEDRLNLGEFSMSELTSTVCHKVYETWTNTFSVSKANYLCRVFSVLMSHAMSLDLIQRNPMAVVKKIAHNPKSITWTSEQVHKFIDVAMSKWEWRNVGLIAAMCYEWAQRPIDIRYLKWYNIKDSSVVIKQAKRGAEVELPISPNLKIMLDKQQEDFGFQEWVVPYEKPTGSVYIPMSKSKVNTRAREILKEAGLPEGLRLGYLRKTAINEMVEKGVSPLLIKTVTGHKRISSLNPYLKNTLKASTKALQERWN